MSQPVATAAPEPSERAVVLNLQVCGFSVQLAWPEPPTDARDWEVNERNEH